MATLAVIAAAALIPSAAVARTDPPSSPGNSGASPATKQAESTVVSYGYPVTSSTSDDGFQWGDAALGAGIVAALGLAGFGIAVLYRHHRSLSAADAPAAIS